MCLAIPVRIISVNGTLAQVDANGLRRQADVRFIDNPRKGDYVLLHAGFAIEKIDEKEAHDRLKLLKDIYYEQ